MIARCEHGKKRCEEAESFATLSFTYDAAKRDLYDGLVAAMSRTLTAAKPPY